MILIDGIIYRLQSHGGISVCFNNLLSNLNDIDEKIKVVSYIDSEKCNSKAVSDERVIIKKMRLLERYRDLKCTDEVRVFHSSYYRLPNKNNNIKVVTTVHDFVYEKYRTGIAKWVHFFQKKRAILNSDVIVCISENTKSDLHKIIPETKNMDVRVIYNGCSEKFYEIKNKKELIMPTLNGTDIPSRYLIYVGSRAHYKNFTLLVQALSTLDYMGYSLLIVGGGEITESEHTLLEKHLSKRYNFVGFVSDEKLNVLYNKAKALVYPSSYEGFGIPIVEAMRTCCPVIALNSSSIPEVSNNAAILLDEITSNELEKALNKLDDVVFRKELIALALDNSKRFSWKSNAYSYLSLYNELMSNN